MMHKKEIINIYNYSHPQIDGKVNPYQFDGDLLFHLFGDDYMTYDVLTMKFDGKKTCHKVIAHCISCTEPSS